MTRRALIAGASGLVGSELLTLLLDDPAYARVTSLVRRASGRVHDKLDERVIDFSSDFEVPQVDNVFVALGTTRKKAGSKEAFRAVDFDAVLAVAKAAKRTGAQCFVMVSSVGADARSTNFYLRVKGEAEDAVRALGFAHCALLRPSFLEGDRKESRPLESAAQPLLRATRSLFVLGLRKYRPIHARDVARAAIGFATRDANASSADATNPTAPTAIVAEYSTLCALASATAP